MKGFARTLVAAGTAAVLLLAPLPALPQQSQDGYTPPNGMPPNFNPIGGWDGTTNRILGVDGNRVGRFTDFYAREFQSVTETIFGSTITASSTENTAANPFSNAAVYGIKYLRIKQTGYASGLIASGLAGGAIYRIRGSMDGVNYHPILLAQIAADTVKVDTLQYKLMSNAASPATNGLWFPLVNPLTGGPLPFKWLQVGITNRGNATITVELEVAGRQY